MRVPVFEASSCNLITRNLDEIKKYVEMNAIHCYEITIM